MRVIAGTAKGRHLVAPRGLAVRPTTDKVKEAIFSMLTSEAYRRGAEGELAFRRVLDLYAGTGALGIEALSRGAGRADFVEPNPRARTAIGTNLERTGFADRAAVHATRAEAALSTLQHPYDLILLDPPYQDPRGLTLLEAIGHWTMLAEDALLVLEHARAIPAPEHAGRLRLIRTRYHGATAISLFHGAPGEGDPRTIA